MIPRQFPPDRDRRLLVACEGEPPLADGVLAAAGCVRLDRVASFRAATEWRPDCLLLDPAFEGGRGLDLLAVLETRETRVPVLVLFAEAGGWPPRSRFLSQLRSPICNVGELRGQVIDAVRRAATSDAATPMFSAWDYLSLAAGSGISATLALELATDDALSFELVDGELYGIDGPLRRRPLRQLLEAAVYAVEATPVARRPAKRPIYTPAPRLLGDPRWRLTGLERSE